MKAHLLSYCLLFTIVTFCQDKKENLFYFQAAHFYGNIIAHNKNVGHFLVNHPTGFILSYNKKTIGKKNWEHRYNYPDFGISTIYQDYKNPILGKSYSVYGHSNFYLLPRTNKNQLVLRTGLGLAYNTNVYDKVTNPRNFAFGTKLNIGVYLQCYYKRENIINNIGVNAGFSLLHSSNASLKAPNTGLNVWAATIGLNYNLETNSELEFITSTEEKKFKQPIKYNFEIRFGASETGFIGSGIKPFYVLSAYADKRLNRKTAIQFGSELMVNYSLKNYVNISATLDPNFKESDFKRVGVFVGHELFMRQTSLIIQLGYYIYYPFELEGRFYNRFGLKRYFKDKWFASINLKTHAFKAETAALGVGIRI
ncbi:MAG: acyloxyacyl hydrolase [Flavobacteriaceae bacterium]|nr:acyloxyacyl hydrolase [Flavobacteriaceae bacterium]